MLFRKSYNQTGEMKMKAEDLNKLIRWHVKLKAQVAEREAQCKEDNAEDKSKLAKIQAKLQQHIHKDDETGQARVVLPDSSYTAYARYEDKYKLTDRDLLIEDYILEGVPQKYVKQLRERLNVFSNTLVKDPMIDYRLDTGAEEENKRLIGGDLPPGVGLYVAKDVRILKGSK